MSKDLSYHFDGHQVQEVVELDDAATLGVDLGDHLLDFLSLWLKAEGPHGNF